MAAAGKGGSGRLPRPSCSEETQCHTIARLCWTTIAPVLVPPEEQEAPPVAMILSMDQHTMEKLMGKL